MMRRAFTLVEMVFYTTVFALVALLAAAAFQVLTRAEVDTIAAYAVTGDADITIEWLRRDLEETALGSVSLRVPQLGVANPDLPGVSMISSRTLDPSTTAPRPSDKAGELWISEYGVPRWTKHVFYALRPVKDSKEAGELVRWEQELTGPALVNRLPTAVLFPKSTPSNGRVMLHNVVMPGAEIEGLPGYTPDAWGGFRVQFLRREHGSGPDYPAIMNPSQNLSQQDENTRLLDLNLAVVDISTGKPNYCSIHFRVMPHY